jgi:hypothetical protein
VITNLPLLAPAAAAASPLGPVLRSIFAGFVLANNGASELNIGAGLCADSSNTVWINGSALTKDIGALWAPGNGAGGMAPGITVAPGTWYHVLAILNDGNPDVYFDTSPIAANAPPGTTAYRWINSIKTDGSAHILAFSQDGDEMLWGTPFNELNNTAVPTSPTLLSLVGVPPGVKVYAKLRCAVGGGSGVVLFQSPDEASAIAAAVVGNADFSTSGAIAGAPIAVRTNTAAQLRWSANAGGLVADAASIGWVSDRGRYN